MAQKKDEGHEPAKDAFDMSDDAFQEELDNAQTESPKDDTVEADTDKGGGDTEKIEATPPGDVEAPPAEEGKAIVPAAPTDTKPDSEKPPDSDKPPEDAALVEITHNGVVYRVTPEKYKELAQKGYDYDHKIGPHARLVQLINSKPEIATMVHDYVVRDVTGSQPPGQETTPPEAKGPELKPLKDYESTEDWLRDNLETFAAAQPKPEAATSVDPVIAQDMPEVQRLLYSHDPHHYQEVVAHFEEEFENLTMKKLKIIESSYAELEKFYDEVKKRVVPDGTAPPQPNIPPETPVVPPVTPAFHVKPGGGAPDRTTDQADLVWEMSNKDFDATLAKAKGF